MLVGSATHIGKIRDKNEDALFVGENIYAVADGMGGHNAGEIASHIAVDFVKELLGEGDLPMPKRIEECFSMANNKMIKEACAEKSGMGTTLTLAVVCEDTIIIGHIGDSRAYLVKADEIQRLTIDHSVSGELFRSGFISEAEAKVHPQRNALTRSLGDMEEIKVDLTEISLHAGEYLVLCTDGLHSKVDDSEIKDVVFAQSTPQKACDELVKLANKRGGHDNITCIIVKLS